MPDEPPPEPIVVSDADADLIADLLANPRHPTPAMVAMFHADPPKLVMTLEEAIALAERLEAAQGNPEKS